MTVKRKGTLKVYKVRVIQVWEEEWTALSREAAVELSENYHAEEGFNLLSARNHTTARVVREATPEETDEYWGDTRQDDDDEETQQ